MARDDPSATGAAGPAKRQRLDAACTYSHVLDPSFAGSSLRSDVTISIAESGGSLSSDGTSENVLIRAHQVVLMSNSSYFYAKVSTSL